MEDQDLNWSEEANDGPIEGEPDSLAKGMALQRALAQLSRIQNIVPNFQTVKAEMTTLIKHYRTDKDRSQEQDESAPADVQDVADPEEQSAAFENSESVHGHSQDEQSPSHSPNQGQMREISRQSSDHAKDSRTPSAEEIEDQEGQQLVMVAMPASAFLSTIGGKSVGTVMEQKKEELNKLQEEEKQRKKEASRLRRLLEAKEESRDAMVVPGLPVHQPAKKQDSFLQLTEEQQKQLRALRLAVSRTVKGVRDNKSMRWGEPDLFQVKTLIDQIKFGLTHVREPSTIVPKLILYISSFGNDWDELVRKVKLSHHNLHEWADQDVWQTDVEAFSPAVANMEVPLEWIDPNLLKQWEEMQLRKFEASKKMDLDSEELQEINKQEKRIRRLRVRQALINAARNGRLNQVLQSMKFSPGRGSPSGRRMSHFESHAERDRRRSVVGHHHHHHHHHHPHHPHHPHQPHRRERSEGSLHLTSGVAKACSSKDLAKER